MKTGLTLFCAFVLAAAGQEQWKFPCPENEIARYTAHRASEPIRIDGKLDEAAWQRAPRSPRFIDIISGAPAIHDTRAAVLWDSDNLYVAFWIEEPLVRAKYTNRNDPIYYDNDVELFIADGTRITNSKSTRSTRPMKSFSSGMTPTKNPGSRARRNSSASR